MTNRPASKMMFATAIIWLALFLQTGAPASAAELVPLLAFPEETPIAGQTLEFQIYYHNEGSAPLSIMLPHQLQIFVNQDDDTPRQLTAFGTIAETTETILPGGFSKKAYNLSLPVDLHGTVHYKLGEFESATGVLLVRRPEPTPAMAAIPNDWIQEPGRSMSLRNLETLYQSYAANFSAYQPTYFLVGTDPEKSKLQISFKYRLFNPSGSLSRKHRWLEGFHLAYTQTSYWDLASDSAPFEDTSYKPELFYQTDNLPFRPSWLDGFVIQAGIQHESNGRGGEFSRSTNYAYLRPTFIFYHQPTQLGMLISPRIISYYNNNDETNPDLDDYRGYFELETAVGKAHSLMLRNTLRFAEKGTSIQADLTYPIHRLLRDNLDLYFQIQYSNARGESLINYRDRVEAIRLGIAIVR